MIQRPLKISLQFALLAALPAELLEMCLFAYPVDNGFTTHTHPLKRPLQDLWLLLHQPALLALGWMERRGASALDELAAFYLSGYCGIVLLLFLLALVLRWIWRLPRQQVLQH